MKRTAGIIIYMVLSVICWGLDEPRELNSRYYNLLCWGQDINEFTLGELLEEDLMNWSSLTGINPNWEKGFNVYVFSDLKDRNQYLSSLDIEIPDNESFLLTKSNPSKDILVILLPETIEAYQQMHLLIFKQINRRFLPLLSKNISQGLSHYLLQQKTGNWNDYLTLWKRTYVDLTAFNDKQNDIFYWGLVYYCMKSEDIQARNLFLDMINNSRQDNNEIEEPRWDNEDWQSVLLKMHRYFTLQMTLKEKQDKAIALFEEEEWDKARQEFNQLDNAEVSPLVSYYLALIEFEVDNFDSALSYIESSYTQGLREDLYLYSKGTILWEKGEHKDARDYWNKALEVTENNELYKKILNGSREFLNP